MKQKIKPKMVLDNDGKPVTDIKKALLDFDQEWFRFNKIRTEIEILPADEAKEWKLGLPTEEAEEPMFIVIKNRS